MTKFNTINDAQVAYTNDGFFEAADIEREQEIIEFMFRNDCDLETALNELDAWL
ncbi:hypothetical protein [Photobacterium sp. TLY01]|uniref:hypothetical protein n=1 Tax=Photobacterium sp. TLY01 TaxID=2907534 RepID=UPI001F2DD13B|nr:hypothetical protein [Photobacterium sp. TLY01]UIP28912.1 hypothetical protein LN341_05370 [Photobacterium sp. TLY01]